MIEEIFNLFDTDGEQQLDEDELAAAIFAMGFSQCDHVQVPEQHQKFASFAIFETLVCWQGTGGTGYGDNKEGSIPTHTLLPPFLFHEARKLVHTIMFQCCFKDSVKN